MQKLSALGLETGKRLGLRVVDVFTMESPGEPFFAK